MCVTRDKQTWPLAQVAMSLWEWSRLSTGNYRSASQDVTKVFTSRFESESVGKLAHCARLAGCSAFDCTFINQIRPNDITQLWKCWLITRNIIIKAMPFQLCCWSKGTRSLFVKYNNILRYVGTIIFLRCEIKVAITDVPTYSKLKAHSELFGQI